jgi:ribosomal protein L7/L12
MKRNGIWDKLQKEVHVDPLWSLVIAATFALIINAGETWRATDDPNYHKFKESSSKIVRAEIRDNFVRRRIADLASSGDDVAAAQLRQEHDNLATEIASLTAELEELDKKVQAARMRARSRQMLKSGFYVLVLLIVLGELYRQRRKSRSAARDVATAAEITDAQDNEIRDEMRAGRKLDAIKLYKDWTGSSLADARIYVDGLAVHPDVSIEDIGGYDVDQGIGVGQIDQILDALEAGKKLDAIKIYKERSGLMLMESKKCIEDLIEELGIEDRASGCSLLLLLPIVAIIFIFLRLVVFV